MGGSFSTILAYCLYGRSEANTLDRTQIRGELIYTQGVDELVVDDPAVVEGDTVRQYGIGRRLDVKQLAQQFQDNAARQPGLSTPVWHQMFSFPIGESPTNDQLDSLIEAWKETFGFEHNQLAAFRHRDKEHEHIHLVGNRINSRGVNSSIDAFNYRETGRLCRRMEAALKLTPTAPMHHDLLDGRYQQGQSPLHDRLRHLIDEGLLTASTMRVLSHSLHRAGIKTILGRGVTFVDEQTGIKTKGSELGRAYSLASLSTRLVGATAPTAAVNNYSTQSKQAVVFRSALDEGLSQTSSWPALQLFLIDQKSILVLQVPVGEEGSSPTTSTYQLGVFRAGQLRTMPFEKLGKGYELDEIQRQLKRNELSIGASASISTKALDSAKRTLFREALVNSIRYAQGLSGSPKAGNQPDLSWLKYLDTHSAWQVDQHINKQGTTISYDFNLRGDRHMAGDKAGELLTQFNWREVSSSVNLAVKTTVVPHMAGSKKEMVQPKQQNVTPNQVEQLAQDIYAQGGAQMDRDTKADLAEIQRSLQNLTPNKSSQNSEKRGFTKKTPKRRL